MRHPLPTRALVAGGLIAIATSAAAVSTRTFRVTSYKDFDEGEASGVLLSSQGEALTGYRAERIEVGEAEVFTSAVAADGTLWLGTGDQAAVYAVDPKAEAKGLGKGLAKRVKLDGVLASALALAKDGTAYAGTVPGARLYRIQGTTAKELCKLEGADQIWALVLDEERRTIYAATGPAGRLYAVDLQSGKNRLLWESGERHLLTLGRLGDGALVTGSADEGILFRVTTDGVARALHDFEGDEIRAVVRLGETLYVAVNEFEKKGSPPPVAARPKGTKIVLPATPTPSPPPLPGRERKGRGALYRLDPDGRVEQLHALPDSYFTSLHVDEEGRLFAAAGASGRLYIVQPDRTVLTALDLPERQILTLAFGGAQRYLGTGDAGALYRVDLAPPTEALYLTKVLDAGTVARFGALRWGHGGEVEVESRSGNTARPDATWSAWAPPTGQGGLPGGDRQGRIASPGGRYLQLRARFGKLGVLRHLAAFYAPLNQRPRVSEIVVGDEASGQLARGPRSAGKPRTPVVKVQWKVDNPDDDELVYRLAYREEGEGNWKALGGPDPLTTRQLDWNTETVPDGVYLLRVTASDERANPKERALDHVLVSAPLLVDNRKPDVVDLKVAYPGLTATVRDATSAVTELAWAVDGGDFVALAPRDGVLDDRTEEVVAQLPAGLAPGLHAVALRVVDAADNVTVAQTSFRVK